MSLDRRVSFGGRPFPLEEADEHLGRSWAWGFNFLVRTLLDIFFRMFHVIIF
jgi:hypothetical protein